MALTINGLMLVSKDTDNDMLGSAINSTDAGTPGQLMTSNGPTFPPTFQTLNVNQRVNLLNTLEANDSPSLVDTTSLTSMFNLYDIEIEALCPVNNADFCQLRVSTDGGLTFLSDIYLSTFTGVVGFAGAVETYTFGILLSGTGGSHASALHDVFGYGLNGSYSVRSPSSSTIRKTISGFSAYIDSTGQYMGMGFASGMCNLSYDPINAIEFTMSTGNIASGTIRIYGIPTG